eukprot:1841566-Prymnesium_polylepis.1
MAKVHRASDDTLAQWAAVTPTVHSCLSDLTEELSQILEWSGVAVEEDGSFDAAAFQKAIKSWGFQPVTFLAAALKRRNPLRTGVAVREARAKKDAWARSTFNASATIFDSSLGAVMAQYPDKPNEANREWPVGIDDPSKPWLVRALVDVEHGFSKDEAAAAVARLADGAVYSAGSRLPLLRCEGWEAVLTVPAPPPAKDPEVALAEELAFARSRVSAAVPAVLGTEQEPLPPSPSASKEVRMPMTALAGWLTGAQWKEYPLPADFASGLHTQLLSNTFCDPRHAGTLLTVHGGTLDLGGFAIKSAPHEASAAAAVHAAAEVEVLTEVVGLGPYMLQSEDVRAELRCSDTLTKIGLAPLGTGVKGPTDIGQPYRTTEY